MCRGFNIPKINETKFINIIPFSRKEVLRPPIFVNQPFPEDSWAQNFVSLDKIYKI